MLKRGATSYRILIKGGVHDFDTLESLLLCIVQDDGQSWRTYDNEDGRWYCLPIWDNEDTRLSSSEIARAVNNILNDESSGYNVRTFQSVEAGYKDTFFKLYDKQRIKGRTGLLDI